MITVLFIASSEYSAQLSTRLQAVLDARIEFVDDVDLGLKLVFDKRPQVVCLEDEIAGVSGESIAQHIRLLLGGSAPGIILLHDGSSVSNGSEAFNHVIDVTQPPDHLCNAVIEVLHSLLKEHWHYVWNGGSLENSQEVPSKCPHVEADEYFCAALEAPAPVTQPSDMQELFVQRGGEGAIESPGVGKPIPTSEVPVTEELLQAFENNYRHSWLSSKMRRGVLIFGLLVMLGVVWGGYTILQKGSSVRFPAVSSGVPNKRQSEAVMPSFIPSVASEDSVFAQSQPGWSRYAGGGRDYRIFRSGGSIKAVQVIALEPPFLQARELGAVLTELLGTDQYRATMTEQKDGFTLEHAMVGKGAELLLYRVSPGGNEMRAFVLVMGN